jgi:hypothetical protein
VIEDYLPRQLSDDEVEAAVGDAIAETGAEGLRDMGRVMGVLKSKYTGQDGFRRGGPDGEIAAGLMDQRPVRKSRLFRAGFAGKSARLASAVAQDPFQPVLQFYPFHRREERPKLDLASAAGERQVVRDRSALVVERDAHPIGVRFPI